MTKIILTALLGLLLTSAAMASPTERPLLSTYAEIATLSYAKALTDAEVLEKAVETFTKSPTDATFSAAKKAWLQSRESYGLTESFRLSGGPIDAEDAWVAKAYGAPDEQINAWPLDENMIDYTIDAKGKRTSGNIIDSKGLFNPGGEGSKAVDVTTISKAALSALNENGGDANVATGYHAIEFLLWGQDQDYANFVKDSITHGAMVAGQRPLTDYTTDVNAQRRKSYLLAVTQKLVEDLKKVTSAWDKERSTDCEKDAKGCYRAALLGKLKGADEKKNIDPKKALKRIFSGLGVFIKSEVANERIAVAVLTPSEEDEHSCFSDNTHRDIAQNYQGFKNVLTGTYAGKHYGAAPIDALDAASKEKLAALMHKIETKIEKMNEIAETTEHFDYQIQPNNKNARNIVKLKNAMRKLGNMLVIIAKANGINLSAEDVVDPEETQL